MKIFSKNKFILLFLIIFFFALFLLRIFIGSVWLSPLGFLEYLKNTESPEAFIFKNRLGRALMGSFAGAGLGIAGLLLQVYFKNPLAGPFVLGINSGASLGAALAILVFSGISGMGSLGGMGNTVFLYQSGILLFACLGAFLMMLLVAAIATRLETNTGLLIFGVLAGYFVNSAISIFSYFSASEKLKLYFLWAEGSFNPPSENILTIIFCVLIALFLVLSFLLAKNLNIMKLGDDYAKSSGVNLVRVKFSIIIPAGFLSGIVTAFCGPIAFVGLFVPHIARMLFQSEDHRLLIPSTIFIGAIVTLAADLIAQLPGQAFVLPVNPILTLASAPFVLFLVLRNGRKHG